MSQIKLQKHKPRGRRFSIDDKVLALSIMKQSPKGYRFLQTVFALPSRKTLNVLLNEIPFNCGINEKIIASLKLICDNLKENGKLCTIIFDEMSLEAGLSYNPKNDIIEGFQNCGECVKPVFADHAIVFMARGVTRKWKQPIAYFFTEGGMKSDILLRNLKLVVRAVQSVGLDVVAVVCDQLSTNRSVFNKLKDNTRTHCIRKGEENKYEGFIIDNKEIIALFDPPHLLKGLRNNLLQHDAKFKWKEDRYQTASWKDIVFYEVDTGDYDTKMCYKLTDSHVYADQIKKMEVSNAAQIFSHSLSASMRARVRLGLGSLPISCADTDFLLFGDELFDSVNRSAMKSPVGKNLRSAISSSSEHLKFWQEATRVLKTIVFINKEKQFVPPTISNWMTTIRSLEYFWKRYSNKLSFLCLRHFNQDPLENFFGSIRSHGVRNVNPTPTFPATSFKAIVVNNFMSVHSPGVNCQDDDSEGGLDDLKGFLTGQVEEPQITELDVGMIDEVTVSTDIAVRNIHSYIAGYVIRKNKKESGRCKECVCFLSSNQTTVEHTFI